MHINKCIGLSKQTNQIVQSRCKSEKKITSVSCRKSSVPAWKLVYRSLDSVWQINQINLPLSHLTDPAIPFFVIPKYIFSWSQIGSKILKKIPSISIICGFVNYGFIFFVLNIRHALTFNFVLMSIMTIDFRNANFEILWL